MDINRKIEILIVWTKTNLGAARALENKNIDYLKFYCEIMIKDEYFDTWNVQICQEIRKQLRYQKPVSLNMYKELCVKDVKEVKEGDNNWTFHTSLTSWLC